MPQFVSEALSTTFKCAEFASPPHDAFLMDPDDPVPSIEQTDNRDIFKPSPASLLIPHHEKSSTTGSSRSSSPSRRHYLANISGDESRTSTPASDFSSSLISKYGGVHGPAAFHTAATASPGSKMLADSSSRDKKKYPGLLHPHAYMQSNSGLSLPATHLKSHNEQQISQNYSESNSNTMAYETHSPTPTTSRHHKRPTHKKSSSNHNNSDARNPRPLILLHATLLPVVPPAPTSTMVAAKLPDHVLHNWRLLEQKMADPVLMTRGLLLPHPRDEYDLLEERLLEALELKTPRVWRCGHFYGAEESDAMGQKRADSAIGTAEDMPVAHQPCATIVSSPNSNAIESPSGSDNDEDGADAANDAPVCTFCHELLHVPHSLVKGSAPNRWDIRIYAANGLMRSTAWSAAWSEMERVDVVITPLLTSAQRLALAAQIEREETQAEERERVRERELHWAAAQRAKREEEERGRQLRQELERERARAREMAEQQEAEKLRYMAAAAVAAASERKIAEDEAKQLRRQRASELKELELVKQKEEQARKVHAEERISLGTLLRNCVVVLATDRRNIAFVLLGVLVAFFVFCFAVTPADRTPAFTSAQLSDVNFEPDTSLSPFGDSTVVNYSLPLALKASHSTATVTSTVTLLLHATASRLPSYSSVTEPQGSSSASASGTLAEILVSATESRPETPIILLDTQNDIAEVDQPDISTDTELPQAEVTASALASPSLDASPSPSSSPVSPVVTMALQTSSHLQQQIDSFDKGHFGQCSVPAPQNVLIDLALPWCAPNKKYEEAEAEADGDEYWELRLIDDYVDVAV